MESHSAEELNDEDEDKSTDESEIDEFADPVRILIAREETTQIVNFLPNTGAIPPNQRNRQSRTFILTRNHIMKRNFSLIDFLQNKLVAPFTRHQVWGSMAWNVDNMLVTTARSLFFSRYTELTEGGGIDNFNDYLERMKSYTFRIKMMRDGGMEVTDQQDTIHKLAIYRQVWHDKAEQHYIPTRFRPVYVQPALDQIIKNERPMSINPVTMKNIMALAKYKHQLSPDVAEETIVAKMVEQQSVLNQAAHIRRAEIAPQIIGLIADIVGTIGCGKLTEKDLDAQELKLITKQAKQAFEAEPTHSLTEHRKRITELAVRGKNMLTDVPEVKFEDLELTVRQTLIERCIGSLDRVPASALRSYPPMDLMELIKIDAETISAKNELKEVLSTTEYVHSIDRAETDEERKARTEDRIAELKQKLEA